LNKLIIPGIIVAVVIAGISTAFLFSSESNNKPLPSIQNEKIGLIVNTPTNEISIEDLRNYYSQASSTGIGRNNLYLFWNLVEPEKENYDWQQSDIQMSFNKQNDLKVTLYFSVINGETLGPFPSWIGKPSIISISEDDLVRVLDAILTRYDIIDSVIIAGDTDAQFRYNEQNIPVYEELFNGMYERLKAKHPQVLFGNAFSLHGVINKDLSHIVEELDVGDFVAFSYFPVDSLNEINKTPLKALDDLQQMLDLVPNKKVGIFEISWSTSDFVGGSQEMQTEFVENVFNFYQNNESKLEFVTWYRQFDRPEGTCQIDSKDVEGKINVGSPSELGSNEFVTERLGHYICSAGLIDSEGHTKPAWNEFKNQVQMNTNS
jgi:hypothetical protein